MSTYGGVTFKAMSNEQHTFPEWGVSQIFTERQVAGSNKAIFQAGPRRPDVLPLSIMLENRAAYDALKLLLFSLPSTLVYRGESLTSVLLMEITDPVRYAHSKNPGQNMTCDVVFRRAVV